MDVYEPAMPEEGDVERYQAEKAALEAEGKRGTTAYALALTNLAASLGNQGGDDEALQLYVEAKAAHEASGSTDSPAYADVLQNLGDHLNDQGRQEEAMVNFSIAREVYETIGWTSTMNYAVLLHNLGVCCFRQGKEVEAQKCYTEARAVYCGVVLGEDSPQFAALLEDMQAAGMDAERPASPKLQGLDLGGLQAEDFDLAHLD